MKRVILSVFAISSLVLPTLLLATQAVRACPDEEPETLLSLYKKSDAIHRARFTGEEEAAPKPEGEGYSVAEISRHFDVFATHKGKSVDKVTVYDQRYIYDEQPVEPAAPETVETVIPESENIPVEEKPEPGHDEAEIDEEGAAELKPGDEVLLFLRKSEEGDRLELTDYMGGAKKLERADMAVYEARVKDLNTIFASKKPSTEKIVDWLIKCAEEKATRWEGTYELQRSFDVLDYKKAREAEEKDAKKDAPDEVDDPAMAEEDENLHEYAEAMTESHQNALTDLFIALSTSEKPAAEKNQIMLGNLELMNLVTRWADDRIALILAEKIRSGAYDNWENLQMMNSIAKIFGDKKLEKIAAEYEETAYQDDNEKLPTVAASESRASEKMTTDSPKAAKAATTEPGTAEDKKTQSETQPATSAAPEQKVENKPATYGEMRTEIAARFLDRADKVILKKRSAAKAQTALKASNEK
jgi:hypothetical protein